MILHTFNRYDIYIYNINSKKKLYFTHSNTNSPTVVCRFNFIQKQDCYPVLSHAEFWCYLNLRYRERDKLIPWHDKQEIYIIIMRRLKHTIRRSLV